MGFEIIDYLTATPNRVYATLKLIHAYQNESLTQGQFFELLQPHSIQDKKNPPKDPKSSVRNTFTVLHNLGFISSKSDKDTVEVLKQVELENLDDFKLLMQKVVLGATEPEDDNFILSQFTAWYASYGHLILEMSGDDIERKFHEDLYPSVINDGATRKLQVQNSRLAWGLWARFLGYGKEYKFPGGNSRRKLMPNARERILPLLPEILPNDGTELTINEFVYELSIHCPELDGGKLYNSTYTSIHNSDPEKSNMSLMLSTALRALSYDGIIEVIDRPDAKGKRQLFPTQSYIEQISHVRITEKGVTS